MNDKISVLVSARKNSKFLAKFLMGYFGRTDNQTDTEILVMLNAEDTWNADLAHYFWDRSLVRFYSEDHKLGRAGLHQYFNDLLQHASGDWIVYFCEDHYITLPGWDTYVRRVIAGLTVDGDAHGKKFPLDPNDIWVLVPQFDNAGSMNHIVSRGFINALGDKIGNHGWIDSYINDLMREFPDRVIRLDDVTFHDFTHDQPNPMSDAHHQAVLGPEADKLPAYGGGAYERLVIDDREKIKKALGGK